MLPEHPRSGNALTFLKGRLSASDMRSVAALLAGSPTEILKHVAFDAQPRSLAKDAYEPPVDNVSKALVQLLELLKQTMKASDYKAAEMQIGNIMTLSRERVETHETELN